MRKDLDCGCVYSELKHRNVYIIFTIYTDNIHIVLENDNTVLKIKGLKKVVNVKFSRNTHLIETSYDRFRNQEKSHFSNTGKSC